VLAEVGRPVVLVVALEPLFIEAEPLLSPLILLLPLPLPLLGFADARCLPLDVVPEAAGSEVVPELAPIFGSPFTL
jgi:hypothetical protein